MLEALPPALRFFPTCMKRRCREGMDVSPATFVLSEWEVFEPRFEQSESVLPMTRTTRSAVEGSSQPCRWCRKAELRVPGLMRGQGSDSFN